VLQAMMLFQQAQHRAKAAQDHAKAAQDQAKVANKVALQAEKDNDAAQKELQELQRVMEPKRARTHAATADDDEECEKQSCDDWDLPGHRREATRIQNHRSIPLGFYNKDSALVIKRWLNRVEEDESGLTFQEWTPDVDTSRPPVAILINSSELCAGFQAQGSASSST